MPDRVQMTRHRPWRADHPSAVIVARPTVWGNPFRITQVVCEESEAGKCWQVQRVDRRSFSHWPTRLEAQQEAVDAFELELRHRITPEAQALVRRLPELRGQDLACWCPLDHPCHADILLTLANLPDNTP